MIDFYYWPTPNGWKVSIMVYFQAFLYIHKSECLSNCWMDDFGNFANTFGP